jgi:ATP-dependent DNA ligase
MLPQISPAPLTSLKEPIGHPNWVYELKHDGFRGILYVEREQAWLVSRKGKNFSQFVPLLKQVLRSLKGQRAILDGEIVVSSGLLTQPRWNFDASVRVVLITRSKGIFDSIGFTL